MRGRQKLPHLWLMTDERAGDALWPALARLPRGAGVVFRHHATEAGERRRLYARVRRIARARRLVLVLAGTPGQAIAWRADGAHERSTQCVRGRRLVRTAPAHDVGEAIAAARAGADLVFVSPVFATRSHPGGRALGMRGFARIARHVTSSFPRRQAFLSAAERNLRSIPIFAGMTEKGQRLVALGGMDDQRFRTLRPLGAYGWAAIDALTPIPNQKRKVVPR